MSRQTQKAWFAATVAAIAMTTATGRVEAASTTVTGISLQTSVVQSGDPQFTYYVNISLANATIPALTHVSIDLAGITGLLPYNVGLPPAQNDQVTVSFTNPAYPDDLWSAATGTDSLSVKMFGSDSISVTGTTLLAQVIVTTPDSPTQTGLTAGTTIDYTYTIGSTTSPTQTVTLLSGPLGVPEPSSMMLMIAGGAVLPYLAVRDRKRRRRPHTA